MQKAPIGAVIRRSIGEFLQCENQKGTTFFVFSVVVSKRSFCRIFVIIKQIRLHYDSVCSCGKVVRYIARPMAEAQSMARN